MFSITFANTIKIMSVTIEIMRIVKIDIFTDFEVVISSFLAALIKFKAREIIPTLRQNIPTHV